MLHQGGPPVVVAASGEHPGRSDGAGDRHGVLGMLAHRLLAEDRLPGRGRLFGHHPVEGIGGGDVHDVHLGMVDHRPPIRAPLFESEV